MMEIVEMLEKEIKAGNFIIIECEFDYQCYRSFLKKSLQLRKIIIKYDNIFDEAYLKVFNRLRDSILKAWRIYEKGDIRSASNIIYNILFSNKYLNHSLADEFEKESKVDLLYRGRIINDHDLIDAKRFVKQIFHIPFDKRNLVGNERYSISGFPCLYLASSVEGVKAELNIDDFTENFFIGDFEVKRPFKCFDLTPFFLKDLEKMSLIEIKMAMLKLLLLMACSIKVNNKKSTYSSNYVIPQLVTASIASKRKYDYRCIKYLSIKSYENKRFDDNYVFIPEYHQDELYDHKLLSLFNITPNKNYNIFKELTYN